MNKKLIYIIILCGCLLYTCAIASAKKNEAFYQYKLCTKLSGVIEYKLFDETRVDCLTNTHAIEVDFAKSGKIYECVGQALHYAYHTNRRPACALIVDDTSPRTVSKAHKYISRLKKLGQEYHFDLYTISKYSYNMRHYDYRVATSKDIH